MRSIFCVLMLLLGFAAPAAAQLASLPPADNAADDPSFFGFRARLLEALARRDTAFLYAHTDPDVRVSFGTENGLKGLKAKWNPSAPESELWPTLARVVGAGGRFQDGRFVAPYVFTDWPDSLDAFSHVAVVGEHVRVRARPSLEGDAIGQLSFSVVPLESGSDSGEAWRKVRLVGGKTGYVAAAYLWSPVGYRAGFEKQGERWAMTFFVAGD